MKPLLIYLFLITIFSSCRSENSENKGRRKLNSLYRQRIVNSNYVLYDFAYSGSFVTNGEFTGLTILKANEPFTESKIERLPGSYFSTKPEIGNLNLVDIQNSTNPTTQKDTLLTPAARYTKTFNGVKFNITTYHQTYGSATMNTGLMRYEFDGLKETNDSLIFYKVKTKFGGKTFPSTTSFLKGNIKLIDSSDHKILYVQINQAIIERGSIYKPTDPLKIVSNQPIVGNAIYEFYPKNTIKSTSLTDIGIWKKVKLSLIYPFPD